MFMHEILGIPEPEVPLNTSETIFVDGSCNVGIEIELEGLSSSSVSSLVSWNRVSEGSVNGFELVLNRPTAGEDLFCAIDELRSLRIEDPSRVFTPRTSVHIHIDIRDLTFPQLINFITLATMFEPVLYNYVAEHRKHNHFCWQLGECQELIKRIHNVMSYANTPTLRSALNHEFSSGSTKYAGINLSSIPRYGSLEFRMHEGTAEAPALIRWINILMAIKNYAKHPERTPSNILETKQDEGIEAIFDTVLGGYKGVLEYQGVEDDILKGIRVAQDFVHEMTRTNREVNLPQVPNETWDNLFSSLTNEAPEPVTGEGLSFDSPTNEESEPW